MLIYRVCFFFLIFYCNLQVSLGNVNKLLNADYNADRLPTGKHSVQGVGAIAPDPSKSFTMYVS